MNASYTKIERNSNIELLRIVCMLMIIGGHIIMKHNTTFDVSNAEYIFGTYLRGAFAVAVNAFILISGYFGITYKRKRLLNLVIQTLTYSVLLFGLSVLIGWHTINWYKDFMIFIPIFTKQYWFVTCYAVLYVIAPFLNDIAKNLSSQQMRHRLIVGFVIIYVWPTISYLINSPQFIGDAGYGIINFTYLYFLGYYLRHHHLSSKNSTQYWGGYFLSITLLFICQYSLSYILGFPFTSWISYNTVFVFFGAVCLFMAFQNMPTSNRPWVNSLAKPCLAVYLIHQHPHIWSPFCQYIRLQDIHGLAYISFILLMPIPIYLVCALIETCRLKLYGWIEQKIS